MFMKHNFSAVHVSKNAFLVPRTIFHIRLPVSLYWPNKITNPSNLQRFKPLSLYLIFKGKSHNPKMIYIGNKFVSFWIAGVIIFDRIAPAKTDAFLQQMQY